MNRSDFEDLGITFLPIHKRQVITICAMVASAVMHTTMIRTAWSQASSPQRVPQVEKTELVLQADAPCMVLIDGVEVARLAAGGVQRVSMVQGEKLIEAIGEHPDDRWQRSVIIEPGVSRVVAIGMKRVISEREGREKTEAERKREMEDRRVVLDAARASLFDDASYISIPPGIYLRHDEEAGASYQIAITKNIWMGRHEVTQAQWESVMGENPSDHRGGFNPVESVSWFEAKAFLDSLNALDASGIHYRLPTEAEWEYACRVGEEDAMELNDVGWYIDNAGESPHPVGQKKANAWGLFDMRGNVWEWVEDWYALYDPEQEIDPLSTREGRARVIRGGSWWSPAEYSTCSYRGNLAPDYKAIILGFRIVREIPGGG